MGRYFAFMVGVLKRRKPTYTDKQKALFVTMLLGQGYPANRYAIQNIRKELGSKAPSAPALRRWYRDIEESNKPENKQIVLQEKQDMAAVFEKIVYGATRHIVNALDDDDILEHASLRDLIIIAGTGVDKMRLLQGESTENAAHKHQIEYVNDWRKD